MWLTHVLDRWRLRRPGALALRDANRDVTWRAFDRDVRALAAELRRRVPPGGRVALLSGNRVEMLEVYFGCARAGVVAAPVNPSLADAEIGYILDSVKPELVIADPGGRRRVAARAGIPVLEIEDVAELPDPGDEPPVPADLRAPAAILHTSATTGRPKGVVVDQRSFQLNAMSWLGDVRSTERTVFLNACPLFHGSMVIALDYLAAGGTVCVLDRFTPQGCLAAMRDWRVTEAFLVPSMVRLLLDTKALDGTDLSALCTLLHGAAPMPASLARESIDRLGVGLQTIYGITEGGGPTISLRPDDRPGTPPVPGATCAGRPMLGTSVRVVGPDRLPTPRGAIGEIHLTGDGLMQGYWQDQDATDEVLASGWLNTKDLGCVDDDGYVWVVDRRNDLILRGGQNVYPAEIEHVLRAAPQVADVAVVPAPSPVWGQTPVAFVTVADGHVFDEADLLDRCHAELASYKRPSHFVTLAAIPRNPAGKILRATLRARAQQMVIEGETR